MNTILLLFAFLLFFADTSYGTGYRYPVTPGSPEWRSLSIEQRIQSQQIPDDLLLSMTTEELYESYLSLPSRIRMLEEPRIQTSFDRMFERFNVLPALLGRTDVKTTVLEHYCAFQIDESNKTDFDLQFSIDMTAILLSQQKIVADLSSLEQNTVIIHALSLHSANSSMNNSNYWQVPTLSLIGRILYTHAYPPFLKLCEQYPEIIQMLHDGIFIPNPGSFETDDIISIATDFVGS